MGPFSQKAGIRAPNRQVAAGLYYGTYFFEQQFFAVSAARLVRSHDVSGVSGTVHLLRSGDDGR
jgi:hypothetical protein